MAENMMDAMLGANSQWATYTLIIVVIIFGMISLYLGYMILTELRESRKSLERVEKLLKTVE
ncbi:MAG: hypothetical protein OIN87_02415 [Candidatus Methanoperedens sp.]|nr:hypothetical protein [Candidatus Methanoperedens sp.]